MRGNLLSFVAIIPATFYSLASLFCAFRFFGSKAEKGVTNPAVTIIKPVKGVDAESYQNFASFCKQHYTGDLQLLFAVASADDPAIAVIRQIIENFDNHDIKLVINQTLHGANHKVSNLINAYPFAKHEIILICDSDIFVRPDWLQSVSRHFNNPETGLVTSLYRTSTVDTVAAAIEATGFTAEMIPNVMVALQLEGLTFALGASIAVRRKALEDIGGFEQLVDYLADDYQLGNKICSSGWQIALDDFFIESIIKSENITTVLSRQLRWSRTMRASRPAGYLASGIIHPFSAVIMVLLLAPTAVAAAAPLLTFYLIRMVVSTIFSRRFVMDKLYPRWLWLLPIRDLLAFSTWALSFSGNKVNWRGTNFTLKRGGKIEENK